MNKAELSRYQVIWREPMSLKGRGGRTRYVDLLRHSDGGELSIGWDVEGSGLVLGISDHMARELGEALIRFSCREQEETE